MIKIHINCNEIKNNPKQDENHNIEKGISLEEYLKNSVAEENKKAEEIKKVEENKKENSVEEVKKVEEIKKDEDVKKDVEVVVDKKEVGEIKTVVDKHFVVRVFFKNNALLVSIDGCKDMSAVFDRIRNALLTSYLKKHLQSMKLSFSLFYIDEKDKEIAISPQSSLEMVKNLSNYFICKTFYETFVTFEAFEIGYSKNPKIIHPVLFTGDFDKLIDILKQKYGNALEKYTMHFYYVDDENKEYDILAQKTFNITKIICKLKPKIDFKFYADDDDDDDDDDDNILDEEKSKRMIDDYYSNIQFKDINLENIIDYKERVKKGKEIADAKLAEINNTFRELEKKKAIMKYAENKVIQKWLEENKGKEIFVVEFRLHNYNFPMISLFLNESKAKSFFKKIQDLKDLNGQKNIKCFNFNFVIS